MTIDDAVKPKRRKKRYFGVEEAVIRYQSGKGARQDYLRAAQMEIDAIFGEKNG